MSDRIWEERKNERFCEEKCPDFGLNCTTMNGKRFFSGLISGRIFTRFWKNLAGFLNDSCGIFERILRDFFDEKKSKILFFPLFFFYFFFPLIFFLIFYYFSNTLPIFFMNDSQRTFSSQILPTRTRDLWNLSRELNRWATAIWNYIIIKWRKDIFKLLTFWLHNIFNYLHMYDLTLMGT